jgi:hypothetical protein
MDYHFLRPFATAMRTRRYKRLYYVGMNKTSVLGNWHAYSSVMIQIHIVYSYGNKNFVDQDQDEQHCTTWSLTFHR